MSVKRKRKKKHSNESCNREFFFKINTITSRLPKLIANLFIFYDFLFCRMVFALIERKSERVEQQSAIS